MKIIQNSFQHKMVLYVSILFLLVSVLGTYINIQKQQGRVLQRIEDKARATGSMLAAITPYYLENKELYLLQLLINDMLAQEEVIYAVVFDGVGRILSSGPDDRFPRYSFIDDTKGNLDIQAAQISVKKDDNIIDYTELVYSGQTKIGGVKLGFSLNKMNTQLAGAQKEELFIGFIFSLLGVIATYILAKGIFRPLKQLTETAMEIARGNTNKRVRVTAKDEIGELADSFNYMLDKLQATTVSKEYVDNILCSLLDGLMVLSLDGKVKKTNGVLLSMLSSDNAEIVGMSPEKFLYHESGDAITNMAELVAIFGGQHTEMIIVRADGRKIPVLFSVSPLVEAGGRVEGFVCVVRDITEKKRADEQIKQLVYYDVLTNLPNRRFFKEKLTQALSKKEQQDRGLAVLYLDLDRFKRLNDTLGHDIGDLVLQGIASRFKSTLPPQIILSRQGGDEFTGFMEYAALSDVLEIAQSIIKSICQPLMINEHEIIMTTSIGISLYPQDGRDMDALIKHADIAMYVAKAKGRNRYMLYSADADTPVEDLQLEKDLQLAQENNEFVLHNKPQFDTVI